MNENIIKESYFGSYQHISFLVEWNIAPENLSLEEFDELEREDAFEDQLEFERQALKLSGAFHEVRHFADCFGTRAGYSLFLFFSELMLEFIEVSEQMQAEGITWKLPIADWRLQEDCPAYIKKFIGKALLLKAAEEKFNKPFSPVVREGRLENYFHPLSYDGGGEVISFPYNMESLVSGKRTHALMPLGYETLIEGNAWAVQRASIRNLSQGKEVDLLKRMAVSPLEDQPIPDSYFVTDLLITKYLKSQGRQEFHANTILAISDMALAVEGLKEIDFEGSPGFEIDQMGALFLRILHEIPDDQLVSGDIPYPPGYMQFYQNLLSNLRTTPLPTDMDPSKSNAYNSIRMVQRYMIHRVVIPLIEARIASDHKVFSTYEGFNEFFSKFGAPPFLATQKGISFTDVPEYIQTAWYQYAMLSQHLGQLMSNDSIMRCPRAKKLLPGLHAQNFAFQSTCQNQIKRGCGEWFLGSSMRLPDCLFSDGLRHFAFEPFKSVGPKE